MYHPTLLYRRTPAEKANPLLSWKRKDKAFFAAGACHILAYKFVELHSKEQVQIVHLKPLNGYSGDHVYIRKGEWAFDHDGWTKEKELLEETKKAYSQRYKGWDYELNVVVDNLEAFCKKTNHRLPVDFPYLPWERAEEYIQSLDNA